MNYMTFVIALTLIGCATPIDVRTASTSALQQRRAEINRKLAEDDLGVAWGVSRWISHAHEKGKVLKERQAIDAELARRQTSHNNEGTEATLQ